MQLNPPKNMKHFKAVAMLAGAALQALVLTMRADMANGSYTNDMGALVPIWDISGDYTNVVDLFTFNYTIKHAVSGILSGTGTFTFVGNYDGIDYNLTNGTGKVTGEVTSSTRGPKLSVVIVGSGTGTASYLGIPLQITRFVESAKLTGVIDETTRQGTGTLSFAADATFLDPANGKRRSGQKTGVYKNVTLLLPTNVTGNWTLTLDLTPANSKAYRAAPATVVTSAGDTGTFTATGAYSAKKDVSAILLGGTGADKGTSFGLEISTAGTNLTVEAMTGTLYGQSLKFKAP
jgi:hypothetical protein